MENQNSRTNNNLNSTSNPPFRSYRRRPFSNGLRKREELPISSNFDIEPSQSNPLSIHRDDQIAREVENIFRSDSDDDEDQAHQIPPVPSTSEVSEKGYLSSLRNPPPSTSSSTLVNEEETYPHNIRKKSRGPHSQLCGMEYGPSHLLSAFEIPQGVHFVHHTPSQPFTSKHNGQSVASSKLKQDHPYTQRSFNHFELRQADHEPSPPLGAERSPSPNDQYEPPHHPPSNTSHSLRSGKSPPAHDQPPSSPRRSYPTAHDQNRFKAMVHSPKRHSLASHQSYTQSSNQDITSSRLSKIIGRNQEEEDILLTPKQTKNTDFCSAAMAAIDQVVTGPKPKVANTTFESKTPRPVDSMSVSRPASARFPRPPFAHLAGRLKAQATQDASRNRQEGTSSVADHPLPSPIQEHTNQPIHNSLTDEIPAEPVLASSMAPLDPQTIRKSVPSTGLQDERRLKGLLKHSPEPQPPVSTVENHTISNSVNINHSGPHLSRTQSQPNPIHKSKPNYDGSVVYKSQRPETHESSIGFERQQSNDKSGTNQQQHGWPATPFLRPKNPDSDSDSGDSPDLPAAVQDQGPDVASQVLLNRHSVRKKVAFVGASDHQGSHEHRLQSQVSQPLHSKVGSSPEDHPYDPANVTFQKEKPRFPSLQHSMSETSVMGSGSHTLATPKITGSYPMTPAPPAPRRSTPLPVPSSSTLSSAPDKRLDRLKAREPEGVLRKQHHDAGSVQTSESSHHLHVPDTNLEKQKLASIKGKGKAIEEPTPRVDLDAYFTPVPKSKKESEPKGQAQRTLDTQLAHQSRRINTDDTLLDATQLEFSRLTAPTPHPPGWFAGTPDPRVKTKPKKRVAKSPPIEIDQTRIGTEDIPSRKTFDASATTIPSSSRPNSSEHLAGPKRDQTPQFVTTTFNTSSSATTPHDVGGSSSHPPAKSHGNLTALHNQPASHSASNPRTPHSNLNSQNPPPTLNKQSSASALETSNERPPLSTKSQSISTSLPSTRPSDHIPAQVRDQASRAQHLRPPTRQTADITHASMAVNCLNLLQQSIRGKLGPLDDVDLMNMSLPPCAGGDYSTFEVSGQQDVGQITHLLKDLLGDIQDLKTTKTGVESLAESSFLLADDTLRPKSSSDPAMHPHSHNSILGALARQSDKVATTRAPLADHLGFNDESLISPESQDVKTNIQSSDLIPKPKTSLPSFARLGWIKIPTILNGYKRYQWVMGLIFLQGLMIWLIISLATVRAVNLAHAGYYYPRYVPPGHTSLITRILQSYYYLSPEPSNSSWWQIGLRSMIDITWFMIDWIFGFRWSLDKIPDLTSFHLDYHDGWLESMIELIFSYFFNERNPSSNIKDDGVTSYSQFRAGFSPT